MRRGAAPNVMVKVVIPRRESSVEVSSSSRTLASAIEYALTDKETRAQNMMPQLEMIHLRSEGG